MQSTSAVKGTPLVACRSRVQARSGRRMQVGYIACLLKCMMLHPQQHEQPKQGGTLLLHVGAVPSGRLLTPRHPFHDLDIDAAPMQAIACGVVVLDL